MPKGISQTEVTLNSEKIKPVALLSQGNDANMDEENISHTLWYTSEVITPFLDEEKERSKRRFNIVIHNIEESSAQKMDKQERSKISTRLYLYLINIWVLKPTFSKANTIGKKKDPEPNIRPRLL